MRTGAFQRRLVPANQHNLRETPSLGCSPIVVVESAGLFVSLKIVLALSTRVPLKCCNLKESHDVFVPVVTTELVEQSMGSSHTCGAVFSVTSMHTNMRPHRVCGTSK